MVVCFGILMVALITDQNSKYWNRIQMVLPSIDVYDIILMFCDLKTGPGFKWSYHLKSGH